MMHLLSSVDFETPRRRIPMMKSQSVRTEELLLNCSDLGFNRVHVFTTVNNIVQRGYGTCSSTYAPNPTHGARCRAELAV